MSESSESPESLTPLQADAVRRRAIEAVVWGMPAVNFRMLRHAAEAAGLKADNQILFWSGLLDWRNQTLTPNPDVIYLMPFFDTTDGPVVLEIPPAEGGAINGSVMNYWQAAIEDVGPAGADGGRGAKYLLLPPDHTGDVPDGYVPLRMDTFRGYALLRSMPEGGRPEQITKALEYARGIQVYALALVQAEQPAPTVFVDAAGRVFDAAIPYDLRFFQALDAMVQAEPFLERDRAMIDQLRGIGISRGRPFAPDEQTSAILTEAIAQAHAWLDERYLAGFTPFADGANWALPADPELVDAIGSGFTAPDSYPVDARGLAYTYAFFSARHLGKGQFYLMSVADADGKPLDGTAAYRLTVPDGVPVSQYWSATVYDRATHTLLREVARPGYSSQSPGLRTNADGSVTLHFGAAAPGGDEANWIPTRPGQDFEVLFRFYGPRPELFANTWRLPDIERV
jgi:hypothetical protein